jgi:polyisoprenoid-binding protein YceI
MHRGLLILVAAAFAGCASAPDALIPKIVPAGIDQPTDAKTFSLDPQSVLVEVDVSAGAEHTLRFKKSQGKLVYAASKPEALSIAIEIDTRSADATLGVVADIAMSSDFLDAQVFPLGRFESIALRPSTAPDGTPGGYDLFGKLNLKNHEKTIQVPATIAKEGCLTTLRSEFAFNRRDFGIMSDGSFDGLVSDTVSLRIEVKLNDCGRGDTETSPAKG